MDHDDTITPYRAADRMQRMPQSLSFQATHSPRRLRGSGRLTLARLALGLLLPAALAAQEIAPAEYAARRDSLAARLDSGVVVAFGAPTPTGIVNPGQLPAFRYLTGFVEPDAALVLVLRDGRASGTLYTQARDPRRALYDGFPPDSAASPARPASARAPSRRSRPRSIRSPDTGAPVLHSPRLQRRRLRPDRLAHPRRDLHARVRRRPMPGSTPATRTPSSTASARGRARPSWRCSGAPSMSPWPRSATRCAPSGPARGSTRSTRSSPRRSAATGGDGPSFGSIIGSGPNSTQYHYETNTRRMRAGEVVVIDVGAAYHGYAADVTRTRPGERPVHAADQRTIYQLVRDAQAAAERVARPGASYAGLARFGAGGRRARGARLGLTEGVDATFDPPWADQCREQPVRCTQSFLYMAHGLGHGIGLEVHDPPVSLDTDTGRFARGDVFTIEPGVYVSTRLLDILPDTPKNRAMIAKVRTAVERYNNIGIRIEDDYAITDTGVEWLSRAPREIARGRSRYGAVADSTSRRPKSGRSSSRCCCSRSRCSSAGACRAAQGRLRAARGGETTVSQAVVVEQTRAVARLVTSETVLRDVVTYENRRLGSTKRSLVVVTGKVLTGFDLDRGTGGDGGPSVAPHPDHAAAAVGTGGRDHRAQDLRRAAGPLEPVPPRRTATPSSPWRGGSWCRPRARSSWRATPRRAPGGCSRPPCARTATPPRSGSPASVRAACRTPRRPSRCDRRNVPDAGLRLLALAAPGRARGALRGPPASASTRRSRQRRRRGSCGSRSLSIAGAPWIDGRRGLRRLVPARGLRRARSAQRGGGHRLAQAPHDAAAAAAAGGTAGLYLLRLGSGGRTTARRDLVRQAGAA